MTTIEPGTIPAVPPLSSLVGESHVGVGRHVFLELYGATNLNDPIVVERALRRGAIESGATLLNVWVHQFSPFGVSGVAEIAESHLTIHTWPELGYAAADFFTCGETMDDEIAIDVFRQEFQPDHLGLQRFSRGTAPSWLRPNWYEARAEESGSRVAVPVSEMLEHARTDHHDLAVFQSPRAGRVTTLDGAIHAADVDRFVQTELLAHPALCAHPEPTTVAIVTSGDAHLLQEVLKHDAVERVHVLARDRKVTDAMRRHDGEADAAFADDRVELEFGNPASLLASHRDTFDVVLVDLEPHIAAREGLDPSALAATARGCLRSGGMVVAPAGSVHYQPASVHQYVDGFAGAFANVAVLQGAMATASGGWMTYVVGSEDLDPTVARRTPKLATRLYRGDAHGWYFVPESVLATMLAEDEDLIDLT